jgi:hypothetical protein
MWYIIIIIIIGYVIYKFNSDRNEVKTKIEKRGGLRKIYPKLFEYLLNDENARINYEKIDEIEIVWKSEYSVAKFRLMQSFNRLIVDYVAKTALLGEIKNSWEFGSGTDQDLMIMTISNDIEKRMEREYDWEGLQDKIDDIVNQ